MSSTKYDVLIVGAGLSGIVMAEQFATRDNKRVLVIDKRDHIGGNIYDYIDEQTNILMSKYGVHIFHTNSDRVWEYVNRFSEWIRWDHAIYGKVDGRLVSVPVNINTVNALCGENIRTTEEMDAWLAKTQRVYEGGPANGEEMAKSRVGDELYEKIFKHYTYKQWARYPEELDASVLARIPIRNNFDGRYFDDRYQALPAKGYTEVAKKIVDHPNITVQLNTDFFEMTDPEANYETIIFTGPIDRYYENSGLDKLEYRSIDFQIERHFNTPFYQTASTINYPEPTVPYTRIVEYKHLLNQESPHTIITKEMTTDVGEPYYPVPNKRNQELYEKYRALAEKNDKIHFIGRLANYKYFNMDGAILNALEYYDRVFRPTS
jgi:UDP-galactopyranose mutase